MSTVLLASASRRLTPAVVRALTAGDLAVEWARNWDEMIFSLRRQRPDAVVLCLRDQDVVPVVREVSARTDSPIIAIGAVPSDERSRVVALDAGAAHCLSPSVGGGELRARIRAAVRRPPAQPIEPDGGGAR
ncbi:MAG: hypothetical protein WB802_02780 [Candidatus Dormiibacterota bacterium]|jgi:two-component system KDP operon response regulator KdpE